MRFASLLEERWAMKAAGWNPELSRKYKTYRAVWKPKKIWEDEINDFLRPERNEDEISNVERNKNEWIKTAKEQEGWKKMENKFVNAAAAPPGTGHQRRRRTVDCVWHLTWIWCSRWEMPHSWCNATTILNFVKDCQRHEVVKNFARDCQQT